MPDENRSERLPFSSRNEPQLQRAVLLFLLDKDPAEQSWDDLAEAGFAADREALLEAIKSLNLGCMIDLSEEEAIRPSVMAEHFHWLMTEAESND